MIVDMSFERWNRLSTLWYRLWRLALFCPPASIMSRSDFERIFDSTRCCGGWSWYWWWCHQVRGRGSHCSIPVTRVSNGWQGVVFDTLEKLASVQCQPPHLHWCNFGPWKWPFQTAFENYKHSQKCCFIAFILHNTKWDCLRPPPIAIRVLL